VTKFSVIMILLAVAALAHVTAAKTSASIERIYTLPFYSNYDITCPWGPYANCISGKTGNHNGTDYSLGRNTTPGEVVAAADSGTLKRCPYDQFGAGNYAVIDHGNGHRTRYLHLLNPSIADQWVARGQVIGSVRLRY
jgi:murein DD-endopeptidase MepM/ murein hydrolase activator NlpD